MPKRGGRFHNNRGNSRESSNQQIGIVDSKPAQAQIENAAGNSQIIESSSPGAESSASPAPRTLSRRPSMPLQVSLRGRKQSISETSPAGNQPIPHNILEPNNSESKDPEFSSGSHVAGGRNSVMNSEIEDDRPAKRPRLGEVSEEKEISASNTDPEGSTQSLSDEKPAAVVPPPRVINRGGRPRGRGRGGRRIGTTVPARGRGHSAAGSPAVPPHTVPAATPGSTPVAAELPNSGRGIRGGYRNRGCRGRGRGRGGRGGASFGTNSTTISNAADSSDSSSESGNENDPDFAGRRRSRKVREFNPSLHMRPDGQMAGNSADSITRKVPPQELLTALRHLEFLCARTSGPLTVEEVKDRKEMLRSNYRQIAKTMTTCNSFRVLKAVKQLIKTAKEKDPAERSEWVTEIANSLEKILGTKLDTLNKENEAVVKARNRLVHAESEWITSSASILWEEMAEVSIRSFIRQNIPISELIKLVESEDPYLEEWILKRTRLRKLKDLNREILIAIFEDPRGRDKSAFDKPQIITRSNQGFHDRRVLETRSARARRVASWMVEQETGQENVDAEVHEAQPMEEDLTRDTSTLRFVKDYELDETNPAHVLPPKYYTPREKEASEALALLQSGQEFPRRVLPQPVLEQDNNRTSMERTSSADTSEGLAMEDPQDLDWVQMVARMGKSNGVPVPLPPSYQQKEAIKRNENVSVEPEKSDQEALPNGGNGAAAGREMGEFDNVVGIDSMDEIESREDMVVVEDMEAVMPASSENQANAPETQTMEENGRDSREASTRPISFEDFVFVRSDPDNGRPPEAQIDAEQEMIDEMSAAGGSEENGMITTNGKRKASATPLESSKFPRKLAGNVDDGDDSAMLNEDGRSQRSATTTAANSEYVMSDAGNNDGESNNFAPILGGSYDHTQQRETQKTSSTTPAPSNDSVEPDFQRTDMEMSDVSYTEFGSGPSQVPGILAQAPDKPAIPLQLPQKTLSFDPSKDPKPDITVETRPDGIVIETRPDNTVVETRPGGVVVETRPDNTVVETRPPNPLCPVPPRRPRGRPRKNKNATKGRQSNSNILPALPSSAPKYYYRPSFPGASQALAGWTPGSPSILSQLPSANGSFAFSQKAPDSLTGKIGSYKNDTPRPQPPPAAGTLWKTGGVQYPPSSNHAYSATSKAPLYRAPALPSNPNLPAYNIATPLQAAPAAPAPVPGPPRFPPAPSDINYPHLQPGGPGFTPPQPTLVPAPGQPTPTQKLNQQVQTPNPSTNTASTPPSARQRPIKYYVGGGVFKTAPTPPAYNSYRHGTTYGSVFEEDGYSKDLNELAKNGAWKNPRKEGET